MNVRFCLPAAIWLANACTISADCMKRCKFDNTRSAELSAPARALIDLMAANGSLPPASAGCSLPGICSPASTFHVASFQSWSRHIWAISRKASSCSAD